MNAASAPVAESRAPLLTQAGQLADRVRSARLDWAEWYACSPKVAAQGKTVLVGWFTAAKGAAKVQFSFSSDAGANFGAPISVEGQGIIGRVEVALLDEQSGIAAWMETNKAGTFLMAARIESGGKMGKRWEIGAMDSGRKSGFPQLEVLGDRVYFAWTEVKGETNQVRTVFLPKAAF
jgi:hypothetical protein